MNKNKIIIVGGGFAGIYTLKHLQDCVDIKNTEITLISKDNYFLFTPMVHEVAGGGLDRNNVVMPIREITKDAVFIQGVVTEIDLKNKVVNVNDTTLEYDYLVLATGATNNFYNIPGAEKLTTPLKTLEDATNIKKKIIQSFENYISQEEQDKKELNFVVVGGGPTGVELVVELHELLETLTHKVNTRRKPKNINVTLICGPTMLAQLNKELQNYTKKFLESLDIEIHYSNVVEVTEKGLTLSDDKFIESQNIFWAAGVKPNYPKIIGNIELDPQKRIIVDDFLQIKGFENVFAIGDLTSGWPMLAYTATRQAEVVAKNILALLDKRPLVTFDFTPKVSLLSLGQKNAVGKFYGFNLKGRLVWFLWRTVYLSKIISFKKKVKIALNWTFNLFVDRDISKI